MPGSQQAGAIIPEQYRAEGVALGSNADFAQSPCQSQSRAGWR